ncbi:poly [ADP-ribose] polymerase tankyrase-1-like [Cloeon dipterum]|uniref:poly [ADP-ribose] polymerase tankyrase-1-like n=1 Tax=Cloeon dipterum TaxID=197152 RepID=UPI00321FF220
MSSKKDMRTVTNTGSTNGVLNNTPKNPPKMEMKLAEEQKEELNTKLDYVKANRGKLPALHFAAMVLDVDVCRYLVEQEGADVNKKGSRYGATALHFAALNKTHGDALIDYLIEKGSNRKERDKDDQWPFDYALKVKNLESAKDVSMNDKKLGKDDEYDINIILKACKIADLRTCRLMLEEFKIHVRWLSRDTWKVKFLCHAAANRNHAREILQYLFSMFQISTDDQRYAYGNALVAVLESVPFNPASAEEFLELLGCNIRFKISGYTFMHYAVTGSLAAVKFVHGKDRSLIDEVSDNGATVLHLAAALGNVEICEWLIEHGQDIYAVNKNNHGSFLHYAAQNVRNGDLIIQKYVHMLLDFVNYFDDNYYTPLHWALVNKKNAIYNARTLLDYGASLCVKRNENNFLHFCIVKGKLGCAKLIHAERIKLIKEKGEGGKTTLHIAADHFNEEICAWLLSVGADPQETTVGGKSVLESTCSADAKKFFQSVITTKK